MEDLRSLKKYLLLITYAILLYWILANLGSFSKVTDYIVSMTFPVLLGFAIAYTLNLPMKAIEKNVVMPVVDGKKTGKRGGTIRGLSILLVFVLAGICIAAIVLFVLPEVVNSAKSLGVSAKYYIDHMSILISNVMLELDVSQQVIDGINTYWKDILTALTDYIGNTVPMVLSVLSGITSNVMTIIISLIMSIYMLASKERLGSVLKAMLVAYVPKKQRDYILNVGTIANKSFSSYISGQVIEAFIIGILCFTGMSLLNMLGLNLPYVLIISVFVGATGLIPMFGAFIGAGIGAFLILMVSPIDALWFVLFILILQQVEGNVIYPRVVGNSLGLKGIYVMLAIIVGGNLFGFIGMILGIPVFATIYVLVKQDVKKRNIAQKLRLTGDVQKIGKLNIEKEN